MRTSRQDAFAVPNGKYYLGDAGYTNGPAFLTPFRSTRYHLKEWAASAQQPKKAEELYNLRHSRARNVVERTFGLWKKRFAVTCVTLVLEMDSEEVWERYVEANEKAAIYKNKVIHNWNEICTIYSKDHATGQGARTGAETENETQTVSPTQEITDTSPECAGPSKKPRMGEAIMCMLGDMKTSWGDAMKSTEPLQAPQVTPPSVVLAALEDIPELSRSDKLRAYVKLILSERLFHALMELPVDFRKEWLLMLP